MCGEGGGERKEDFLSTHNDDPFYVGVKRKRGIIFILSNIANGRTKSRLLLPSPPFSSDFALCRGFTLGKHGQFISFPQGFGRFFASLVY